MAATGGPRATDVLDFLGGFVAAEGTLARTGRRFALRVSLGAADRAMCDLFAACLGVGAVYLAWRAELLAYWSTRARRSRPCTVEGCDRPRRARGLCRRHYYAAYGR
ncbi:MAG TPA: hypothetical protein VFZ77_10620 [Acidimicrobiales bacterium]